MQLKTIHKRFWLALLAMSLGSPAGVVVAQEAAPTDCNPVAAAVVGGVFGALLGGHNKAKGAAIGAGLASLACAAVNYQSRQTTSAQAAREDFTRRNGNAPTVTSLSDYTAAPGDQVVQRNAGQREVIRTTGMIVVPEGGSSQPEEEIVIYPPGENKPLPPTRKPVNIAADGGGFENTFSLPLDKKAPQGTYRYTVRLFANGAVLGERAGAFQAI
jgi:hypothetical protein